MSSDETRLLILRAAERLFLARGIAGVSLREIALKAKQKNPSAVGYHFVDKPGLINAILERHSRPIQGGWLATLRHLDACGTKPSISELTSLFVRPIVAKLDDADGGRAYLSICAELATSATMPLIDTESGKGEGAMELMGRIMNQIEDLDPPIRLLRMMRIATMLYASISDYLLLGNRGLDLPRDVFTEDLVRCISIVIQEPAATKRRARK
jgi:AcrR family transcriptional regulator